MFTSQLPDSEDYRVYFSDYANRHFIKRFAKSYPGKRWVVTKDSIYQELRRISELQGSQQVSELKKNGSYRLFKYEFSIAQSHLSAKNSGNRCIVFLDSKSHRLDILLIYGKTDLPKNMNETVFVYNTVKNQFNELWGKL